MTSGPERIRLFVTFARAVLATLALVSQLVLGTLLLPDEAATGAAARLRAVAMLCTGTARGPDAPARHRHRPDVAATCPAPRALELAAVILMPAVALPSLVVSSGMRLFAVPPARGPPGVPAWALHARGPPHLT